MQHNKMPVMPRSAEGEGTGPPKNAPSPQASQERHQRTVLFGKSTNTPTLQNYYMYIYIICNMYNMYIYIHIYIYLYIYICVFIYVCVWLLLLYV